MARWSPRASVADGRRHWHRLREGHRLETSIARIDADILALKASVEHTAKTATGQLNKAGDRLDKVEKAQVEPAAKLAKLSETVDKLRAAQASATTTAAAAPAPAKEVTGSVPQQAAAAAPPKPEVARLPTVGGWVCGTSPMAAP